jgi:PAS domain S-box-containing protein
VARVLRSSTVAVASVAVAALAVWTTGPLWHNGQAPVAIYVLPVLVCAWLVDALAVALAAVLGLVAALFVAPGAWSSELAAADWVRIAVFVALAGSVSTLVWRLRARERAARTASQGLQDADQRLRQALDAGRMVAWRWDAASDRIVCTGRVRELFGFDEVGPGLSFYDAVHPLDRERYRQAARAAAAAARGFDVVFRVVPPDGRPPVWVEKRAAPIVRPDGAFGGFTGVAQDVSDRFELQAAVRARELQLRVLIDAMPALIAYVDRDRRYGLVNRAYEEWFGREGESLAGRRIDDVLDPELLETLRPHVQTALAGERAEFEAEAARRDGTRRVLRAEYVPDVDGDDVRGFFVLVLDVTEDRRRERALADAEREARAANELKDQFLATLSHELRTPLNAMLGYARMAQMGAVPATRAVDVIERNARLQARLVEDLLDVSRMVSGKLQFTMGRVDPAAVVLDVVHMLQPLADAKAIELAADVTARAPASLSGDGARMRQMLVNLVSNAIKFTPNGGRVTVRLGADGGSAAFAVEDTGIGIAPELLPRVFDRFRQADSSASREHGGLGLGLSIARSIAEAHGGTITATSRGLGFGATFTVTLPATDPVPEHAPASAS